jgi:hypothetical protein
MNMNPAIKEEELVFNVVWTGDTFGLLRYFVCSLMANTSAKFRFVTNACTTKSLTTMRDFVAAHADRVVEILEVSTDTMVAHGVALDRVRALRDDGDWFCLIDPDIKASAPFLGDFTALLADHAAVTSGREVWNDDNVVPEGHPGVGGRHFFTADGFVFGSPHLALYRSDLLEETCGRWEVGLGSAGPELNDAAKAALRDLGHNYQIYDTAKIVNALLQSDGHAVTHIERDQLVHVGGLSHWVSPPDTVGQELDIDREPEWTKYPGMAPRHEVARFVARTLRDLDAGQPAPEIPDGLDPATLDKLSRVRVEIIDMVKSHRWC